MNVFSVITTILVACIISSALTAMQVEAECKQAAKARQELLNRMTLEDVILDYELGNIVCTKEVNSDTLDCNYVLENSNANPIR